MKPGRIGTALLCALLLAPACFADEQQDRKKLQAVTADIRSMERNLKSAHSKRDKLSDELRKVETEGALLEHRIVLQNRQIRQFDTELKQLSEKQQHLQRQRRDQQKLLFSQINSAYRLGREEPAKLILNQEDPARLTRTLKYYNYFLQARANKLNAYITTLQALTETELSISEKNRLAKQARAELQSKYDHLARNNTQRRDVLKQLSQEISSQTAQLQKLEQERRHLENVLSTIEEAISAIKLPGDTQPFEKQRGKLRWPVKGSLKYSYGSRRNEKMRWDGWLLSAPAGTSVSAVHHGRVVFSDYLRGHGLLIIVDHGDGYMSLYAHNQMLLKEAGDWVNTREPIAKVGNTGGRKEHALYFEIRHNGKPANPRKWLVRS